MGALACLRLAQSDEAVFGQVAESMSAKSQPGRLTPSPGQTRTYRRIKSYLDSIPAIDLHEHLRGFDELVDYFDTDHAHGASLSALWRMSYLPRINSITPWDSNTPFEDWWKRAKEDFVNVRADGFYRYMWLAFRDLYGVDVDRITDEQAADLNRRIHENYQDPRWLRRVIMEKSNIELMVCDRNWERFNFHSDYTFGPITFNVTTLVWGFHPSEFQVGPSHPHIIGSLDDPYLFARQRNLPVNSLDDYLNLLDHMFVEAKAGDCICLKTTIAYVRSLRFEDVPRRVAERVFGRPRSELTTNEVRAFEDFIMWRLVELSAKHYIPFQIHTGDARIQGSNPILLVNLIDANPQTKFELFHGGYPWVGETGAIVSKYPKHVWLNETWLPTISTTGVEMS